MTYSHFEEYEMSKRLRVVLTNTQHIPTRSEISSIERSVGEQFFSGLPLEWAGWIVENDAFKLSAHWIADYALLDDVVNRVEHNELQGYKINVYLSDDEETEEEQII